MDTQVKQTILDALEDIENKYLERGSFTRYFDEIFDLSIVFSQPEGDDGNFEIHIRFYLYQKDQYNLTLGLGHQFTEQWAASADVSWDSVTGNPASSRILTTSGPPSLGRSPRKLRSLIVRTAALYITSPPYFNNKILCGAMETVTFFLS